MSNHKQSHQSSLLASIGLPLETRMHSTFVGGCVLLATGVRRALAKLRNGMNVPRVKVTLAPPTS